eukprot:6206300-Pleurochrysis_carterae.AAC.1
MHLEPGTVSENLFVGRSDSPYMGDRPVSRSNRRRQCRSDRRHPRAVSSISFNTANAALPNSFAIRTRRYDGAASVPPGRVAGGVHGVV